MSSLVYRDLSVLRNSIFLNHKHHIFIEIIRDRSLVYALSSKTGLSLLKYAIYLKKNEMFMMILDEMDHDTITPIHSFPSLIYATIYGDRIMMIKIINKFKNVNIVDPEHGFTALHILMIYKIKDYIKKADLLLSHRVNPNILDKYGKTVLHYAIELNDIRMINIINLYRK